MGGSSSKGEEQKNLSNTQNTSETIKKEEIGLTPQEVTELMISKANLEDKVVNLEKEIELLRAKLKNYENIAKGNMETLKNNANMNLAQALQNNIYLQNQTVALKNEKYNLQMSWNALNIENQQLKFYCYKMQIMLLNEMQKNSMKENVMNAQSLNTPSPNININKNMNNVMNINSPNFNYRQNQGLMTIIFNIDNKMKFNISALPHHKLGNIFILALYQHGYSNFVNIKNFTFRYSTQNITKNFHDNLEVKSLQFNTQNCPVIEVTGGGF